VILLGRIGIALAGVVTVKVSTVLLQPDQLGSISQLNSLVNLFNMTLVIPVTHYITRGFLDWYDMRSLAKHTREYISYIFVVAFAAMVLSGILQWQVDIVKGFSISAVMLLVFVNLFAQPVNAFCTTGFNLFGERKKNVFITNLVAWSSLGISVLWFLSNRSNLSWSLGQVSGFLAGSISFFFIWKRIQKHDVVNIPQYEHRISFTRKAVFAFSWPILFTSGLWWVQTQSYRFILEKIQGLSTVGLFATAYALAAMPIMLYESIVTQYLEPTFFGELKNQGKDGQVKAWNKYAFLYLPGMAIVGAYIAFATPFLARIFLGEQYRDMAIKITGWAALIESMRSAGGMMFQLGMAKVDNRMAIIPAVAGAILAPVGVGFLGSIKPVEGTIAGLFIAGFVVLIVNVIFSFRVLPVTWPLRRILYGLLISSPVFAFLGACYYFNSTPSFLFSFCVLTISAIAVGGILAIVLLGKGEKTGSRV